MIAHVICANDSVVAVVLDDEVKALKKMKELSDEDFERSSCYSDRDNYDHQIFWHLHEVEVL